MCIRFIKKGGSSVPKIVQGMKLGVSTTIPDNLDISEITDMTSMFMYASIKTIPLLDTSNVTNMSGMFSRCSSLSSIPLLDTSNVTNMSAMFDRCISLSSIPQLDTSNVTNMSGMFSNCNTLTTVPLLDTSKVTYMAGMFNNSPALSNDTLNNILLMCANSAITETYNKTLSSIGLSSAQKATCQTLSNYQTFLDAGWTV